MRCMALALDLRNSKDLPHFSPFRERVAASDVLGKNVALGTRSFVWTFLGKYPTSVGLEHDLVQPQSPAAGGFAEAGGILFSVRIGRGGLRWNGEGHLRRGRRLRPWAGACDAGAVRRPEDASARGPEGLRNEQVFESNHDSEIDQKLHSTLLYRICRVTCLSRHHIGFPGRRKFCTPVS
jgi:hypothetical protein